MDDEFLTYGTADLMIANITLEEAEEIALQLEDIEGVSSVAFENDRDHFYSASALFKISFEGEETDQISIKAMKEIEAGE